MNTSRFRLKRSVIIAASIHLIFEAPAWAGPVGPQVVNGTATFAQPSASTLNVTNSPGAIINWRGFSIGAGELTRFIQQSSSSSVLNRVVGPDISQIYGQLLSNGRVFLINPSGIIIGPGAVVDTAGFVASTLNMLDGDFLAGKLKFQGDANSGSIINQGWIRTGYGGKVILVAPQIENSGLIHTPGGELILAAGQKLTVSSLDLDGVQFEIQAPTDSVINLGKLLADGGAVGVFAGTLRHSGEIRANALVYDEAGRIVLKAQNDIQIAAGSTTSADGKAGGAITIQSGQGLARVAGDVSAQGSAGQGGDIRILGNSVSVVENAVINASGSAGGGQILVGGDYQGSNASIQNSTNTFVGSAATLRADATHSGDGGRIIVWSDDKTQFYGNLSAQGGPESGNGGFAEVSGKQNLIFAGSANLGAPKGNLGNLLLDPLDLFAFAGGGLNPTIIDEATDFPSNAATVSPATLAAITGNVTLFASRYMRISDPITLTGSGQGLTAQVGTYTAPALPDPLALSVGTVPNQLEIGANISTTGGAVSLSAPRIQSFNAPTIATAGGAISLTATESIFASSLALDAGSATVAATAGTVTPFSSLQLNNVSGGSFLGTASGSINTGTITTAGPVTLNSTGSSINTSSITSGGGGVTANAAFNVSTGNIATGGGSVTLTGAGSFVSTGDISAGSAPVSLSGTSVFTSTVDTTGTVALNASAGFISATVDNAATLTATATSNSGSASVNIESNTDLNANSVFATTTACFNFFGCQSGSVNLSATGNVNVGTVTATAPVSGNNSISESVNISSFTGSIRAMSAASQVTAADVTLTTGQGTGGGIGTAATALNIDVERNFTFRPNGEFNALLNGTGPSGLTAQIGVAPATLNYSGTLSRSGGGLTLTASATDTTVTVSSLAVTSGFNQRVFNSTPFITLRVPNGNLTATSITVPEGDTNPTVPFVYTTAPLPVSVSASGDLTLSAYARQSTGSSLAKETNLSSSNGTVTLGAINASKDAVDVTGPMGITVSSLISTGDVTLTSNLGAVNAQGNNAGVEITSGGELRITGVGIGTAAFGNPLDLAGNSIELITTGGSAIGGANPVLASTQTLIVNATNGSTFNVSTGATALANLNLTADPGAVGLGGLAQVTSQAKTYSFASDGTDFTFNPGAIPATQFNNGQLAFTSTSGGITLGNLNVGATGALSVTARDGSIAAGTLDGAAVTLMAGTVSGGAVSITTGNIGSSVPPGSLTITSGNNGFFTSRSGSVTTGTIEADTVAVNSFNGNITVGNIGSSTPAGAVTLTANANFIGGSGAVLAGNVSADSIALRSPDNSVTAGALDAAASISAISDVSIATGTLDSPSITLARNFFCCVNPEIVTGAIGGIRPATNILIAGSTTTIGGAVTGDPGSVDNFSISANGSGSNGGLLIVSGPIMAGNGSTIGIGSASTTNPFQFTTINAGATGTVSIGSNNSIQQTGGGGITAKTVSLAASNSGATISQTTGDLRLDLNGATSLTVDTGGTVLLDANGSQFSALNITKRSAPDAGAFVLANTAAGQALGIGDSGSGDHIVSLTSPSALGLTLNFTTGGAKLTGSGIVTSGGNVSLTTSGLSGSVDGTTGGITTGGGAVTITASGPVTTGLINTTGPASTGGALRVETTSAAGNITVSNNLSTGPGAITLQVDNSGSITGGGTINSDSSVTATTPNGEIVATGTPSPLSITSPNVTLRASRGLSATGNEGRVVAALTGTSTLVLSGDLGFDVTSSAAYDTLTVATKGSLAGAMNLTGAGGSQTFSLTRPVAGTFQVGSIGGAGLTSATFRATDGHLLVSGPTTINAANLTLETFSATGDLMLEGISSALNLSNTNQNFSAGQDLLITGNVTLSATSSQTLTANRDLTVLAQGGSIGISAAAQDIFASRAISFSGGTAADQKVTVAASTTQSIRTNDSTASSFVMQAGSGDRASVSVSYGGTGTQNVRVGNLQVNGGGIDSIAEISAGPAAADQYIAATGNIVVNGGDGANAFARIRNTGTGTQQIGESFCCSPYQTDTVTVSGGDVGSGAFAEITAAGTQNLYVVGTVNVLGGTGSNSYARIESLNAGEQRIGFPTSDICCSFNTLGSLNIVGGSGGGAGSYARIATGGLQRITTSSSIALTGDAADASASLIGADQIIRSGSGALTLVAGAGNNANALIQSTGSQYFYLNGLSVMGGGGVGATATAQVLAADSQYFGYAGTVSMIGGAGAASFARVNTPMAQTMYFSSIDMSAGSASGSYVKIDSALDQYLQGGNINLTAKGTEVTPIANLSAAIEGQNQTIYAGAVTLTGGSGISGGASDAVIRNTAGAQYVNASSILMNGGHTFSTTGVLNQGTGTQTVNAGNGITMTADPTTPPAHADSFVLIQNTPSTDQFITGALSLTNSGAGTVAVMTPAKQTIIANNGGISITSQSTDVNSVTTVSADGDQLIRTRFVDVQTAPGSAGNASLSATGNQWIHTTAGTLSGDSVPGPVTGISLRAAAMGTGTASVTAGASQLLELDYPEQMQGGAGGNLMIGDVAALGISRVKAVDQNVFARSIVLQSGGVNSISELKATGTQIITTLQGGISVLGGSGDNSLAQIDPLTQIILSNGAVDVAGGSGLNAIAQIVSSGVQVIVGTNGNITLTGGTGANADALISTPGSLQTIGTVGNITLSAGAGAGADASIISANGTVTAPFTCGAGCTLGPPLPPGIGGGSLVSSGGASSSSTAPDATSSVLADQANQDAVLGEIAPPTEESTEERVPICR